MKKEISYGCMHVNLLLTNIQIIFCANRNVKNKKKINFKNVIETSETFIRKTLGNLFIIESLKL